MLELEEGASILQLDRLTVTGLDTSGQYLMSIAVGKDHGQCLLSGGFGIAFGNNENGKLGIGVAKDTKVPELVRSTEKFVDVACGRDFSIWVSQTNHVFSCGVPKSLVPTEMQNVTAVACSAYNNSAAVIDCDGNVVFWPDFHDAGGVIKPKLLTKAKSISCGNGFVAVLLANNILMKVTETESACLYVTSRVLIGGERFIRMSACESYIIAIDQWNKGWIFGEFNGFSKELLASEPVFTNVSAVWAMPNYCCAMNQNFVLFGMGKIPAGVAADEPVFAKMETHIDLGNAVGSVAGNEHELYGIPIHFTREMIQKQADFFIPEYLTERMPISIM